MQDEVVHGDDTPEQSAAPAMPSEPSQPTSDFVMIDEPAETPDDLSAIAQVLEQPTAEIMGVGAAMAQADAASDAGAEPIAAPMAAAEPEGEPVAAPEPEAAPVADADATAELPEAVAAAVAAKSLADAMDEIPPGTVASDEADESVEPVAPAETPDADAGETPPEGEGEPAPADGDATPPAEGEPAEPDAAEGAEAEAPADGEAAAVATPAAGDEVATEELGEPGPITTVSWWPFVAYLVVWLGGAAYLVYELKDVPLTRGIYETQLYSYSMLAGLSLLAAGPVLLLIVWIASFIGRKPRRIGLMFLSALIKGATATLLGAVIWMAALFIIDYLRHGRVL